MKFVYLLVFFFAIRCQEMTKFEFVNAVLLTNLDILCGPEPLKITKEIDLRRQSIVLGHEQLCSPRRRPVTFWGASHSKRSKSLDLRRLGRGETIKLRARKRALRHPLVRF